MDLLTTLRRTVWMCGLLCLLVVVVPRVGYPEEAPSRHTYPDTTLVRAGEPAAWVIYPSGQAGYRELAERIAAAVKTKTGVALPLLTDTEVTETNHPVLLIPYRNRNLILLGRLGINRAMWGVYNRFLCAEDGYYPGGTGYVVRTSANVYKNGANTVIAGGSSDTGAVRAVDTLVARIAAQPYVDGHLTLPWLLDVELGGACKAVFDQDERRQMARIFPAAPGEDPHSSHPVKQFYENIMSYYWSGRESYLKLGLRFLDHVLEENNKISDIKKRGVTGHYAAEFFVRAYDMLDDSGLLSAAQIRMTDRAILDGFYNIFGYDPRESEYRCGLKKGWKDDGTDNIQPVDDIDMQSHGNSMWLADKTYADFILATIPETPGTAAIYTEARRRQSLYVKAFDALIAERWRSCVPASGDNDNVTMTLFRYALEMERYGAFFDSGNARNAALYFLARAANPSGLDIGLLFGGTYDRTEYGLFAGITASYFNDGELKYVLNTMPGKNSGFYGLYVNGVHAYQPGPELQAAAPTSLLGATSIPLQPVHYRRMKCTLPYEQTYNFATIRNGFGNEEYLLLSGGLDLPGNVIVRLASQGNIWLSHTTETRNFSQNALYISRLSPSAGGSNAVPPAARLDHIASASAASFISSTLPGYAGTDWNRQIVCLPGTFFLVIDKVTAQEPDQYLIMANWRPNLYTETQRHMILGPAEGQGGRLEKEQWVVRGSGHEFVIASVSSHMQRLEDADTDPVTRLSTPVYRQRIVSSLKKGESVTLANLLFTRPAGSNRNYELRQTDRGGWLVRAADAQDNMVYIGALPETLGKSDAPLVVLTTNRLTVFNARTLEIRGKVWADHEPPTTREIDLDGTVMQNALRELWNSGKASGPTPATQEGKTPKQDNLVREWRYTGAQQPGLIAGTRWMGSNTWDLGRVADLSRISVRLTSELTWAERDRGRRGSESGTIHSQVLVSVEGTPGTFTPFRGAVVDIAVPTMQGYGRITTKEKVYQSLRGIPQKAHYVKVVTDQALTADHYLFYDAAQPDEREPLRAQVVALRDPAKPDLLVYPDIWPGFRNVTRLTHSLFAVDSEGQERWGHEMKWRIIFVRALDWEGTGRRKVFVGSLDNNVYVYDGDGKLTNTLTVDNRATTGTGTDVGTGAETLADGGYPLGINIGLWQPDATGRRKLILPRYVRASLLGRDGRPEGGTGYLGLYWVTDVLDVGFDFTGDGVEDSVTMAAQELFPLIQGTNGVQARRAILPAYEQGSLSGSPTLAFHPYGKGATALFVARQNLVALFDLKTNQWLMRWVPETPITAAVALPELRQILCYTREGLLWRFTLGEDLSVIRKDAIPATLAFTRFAVLDRTQGSVVAASPDGLFRIDSDNTLTQLAPGSFVDVDVYPSNTAAEKIIAVDKTGAVEAYRLGR